MLAHIAEIRATESESPMIPNAVVIAFDKRVRFEATTPVGDVSYARVGVLAIPVDESADDADKPGFVVDGQQRLAAIRDAAVEAFPICVSAFIAHGIRDQIEQFILVNSTKPLPKGLIHELLPSTETTLPSLLRKRRFPAYLLDRLNRDRTRRFGPHSDADHTTWHHQGQLDSQDVGEQPVRRGALSLPTVRPRSGGR